MKIVGLIAEYNPFHNGHQYHIEKARQVTGADAVIVVISGNFVQRGVPAIMPKHIRTQAALLSGVSLVLELPVAFATSSAEHFAYGAVSILHQLGCVDAICFGSECGDIEVLQKFAAIIHEEPEEYKLFLNQHLHSGYSYPLARQMALKEYLQSDLVDTILGEPNNILGIEYLKALKRLNSSMKPFTIPRISSHYHDTDLRESYSSASAIRNALQDSSLTILQGQIPSQCTQLCQDTYGTRYPIYASDISLLLKYKLLSETKESIMDYADVSKELANRIYNRLNQYQTFEQFVELLKTKEITYTRISRALLHILLGIKAEHTQEVSYARVLGFSKEGANVFSQIKKQGNIPLISKLANTDDLDEFGKSQLELDIYASNLYESIVADKFKTPYKNEYEHPIVRI